MNKIKLQYFQLDENNQPIYTFSLQEKFSTSGGLLHVSGHRNLNDLYIKRDFNKT